MMHALNGCICSDCYNMSPHSPVVNRLASTTAFMAGWLPGLGWQGVFSLSLFTPYFIMQATSLHLGSHLGPSRHCSSSCPLPHTDPLL